MEVDLNIDVWMEDGWIYKELNPRQLPKVVKNGKEYFRDDRLYEYRNVDNPHDVIPFDSPYEEDQPKE